MQENNLLKEENAKLKDALQLHKFCSVSVNIDAPKKLAENSKVFAPTVQNAPQPKMQQFKIIPFDPKEILHRLQSDQIAQSQTRLIRINPDQLKPDNLISTGPRDILREAAEHILQDDNQNQQLHQQQQQHHIQPQSHQTVGGVLISSGSQEAHHHDLVISSPGFVRVTPNYISVKSPLAKRAQKVKKTSSENQKN